MDIRPSGRMENEVFTNRFFFFFFNVVALSYSDCGTELVVHRSDGNLVFFY